MAGELQPLDEKFAVVGEDGRPTPYFIKWAQQRQMDIVDATTADQVAEIVAAYLVGHLIWGEIHGTLSDQTDLQSALDDKANLAGGNIFTGTQNVAGDIQLEPGWAVTWKDNLGNFSVTIGGDPTDGSLDFYSDNGFELWTNLGVRYVQLRPGGATFFTDVLVPDEAYGAGWNGSLEVPTKNAVYDETESLIAALATKLPYYVATGDWDGYLTVDAEKGLTIFNPATGAFSGFFVIGGVGSFYVANDDGSIWLSMGGELTGSGRFYMGGSHPFEFNTTPYVVNDAMYHEGNLAFGAGLDYTAGVLTATGGSGGGVLPVVDGSIPPVFLQNPDGSLIYAPI